MTKQPEVVNNLQYAAMPYYKGSVCRTHSQTDQAPRPKMPCMAVNAACVGGKIVLFKGRI